MGKWIDKMILDGKNDSVRLKYIISYHARENKLEYDPVWVRRRILLRFLFNMFYECILWFNVIFKLNIVETYFRSYAFLRYDIISNDIISYLMISYHIL